ncbi:uncharacterized protein Rcd2 isoform X2 [Drosophila kikkawai]|uniref:Uncharacterized protein Rcd2 isoform X2 n=1 Tax=Drosophila kikkawai TaxID=30033 RepID=A0A6P4IL65_DROKI|nr:uncharacterized protein LOC108075334 isoform X3 [Drosophila kikkawai]
MAKLIIIICCFLWFTGLSALPIIDLDEIPQTNPCPSDSQRNDALESCTCLPCPEMPTCSQVLIEVHPGDGKPGSCCPHYECRDTEPVCNGTNVTYFRDKCTKCESCNFHAIPCIQFCDPSVVVSNCLTKSNETAVPLGGTWTEDYGCTLCRCTLDGEPDCQATECPRVYCDWPIRREGECCQTCPDEKLVTPTPPHILILQPYSGPTRGPEIETVSSSASPGSFPLIPDILAPFRTTYSDFYELSSSTTEAEIRARRMVQLLLARLRLQQSPISQLGQVRVRLIPLDQSRNQLLGPRHRHRSQPARSRCPVRRRFPGTPGIIQNIAPIYPRIDLIPFLYGFHPCSEQYFWFSSRGLFVRCVGVARR